jgi:hypothetical protein
MVARLGFIPALLLIPTWRRLRRDRATSWTTRTRSRALIAPIGAALATLPMMSARLMGEASYGLGAARAADSRSRADCEHDREVDQTIAQHRAHHVAALESRRAPVSKWPVMLAT